MTTPIEVQVAPPGLISIDVGDKAGPRGPAGLIITENDDGTLTFEPTIGVEITVNDDGTLGITV